MNRKLLLTFILILSVIGLVFATTWYETKIKCPICKTKNKFMTWGSYGGYIYGWPSKFEYIYWPVTESNSIYSCKKCRYSSIMWDFKISGDTLSTIQENLENIDIKMSAKKDYKKIPASEKLETAELFYKLYRNEPDFWCRFYRIKGYHYDKENLAEKAKSSRLKALSIANDLLLSPENESIKKELYLISGSMKYFTNQDSLALSDLKKAERLTYFNLHSDSTNNAGMDEYLTALISEFIDKIEKDD